MSVTTEELEQYVDKRVVLTVNTVDADGKPTAEEVEGTIQVVNEDAVLIKPKGKTQFDIIETASIDEVKLAPETAKKIKAKKIKPISLGQGRSHLLERHGVTLDWANSTSEENAFAYHEGLDHEKADLGHVHVEPKAADESTETPAD